LREITTSYDTGLRVLVYFWTCERCGARLEELRRREYVPRFDPRGVERFLASRL
jgi:hypothetical protein